MTEASLLAAMEKHGLTVTPTGTLHGGWVAYNHDYTGRGATPADAIADVLQRVTPTGAKEGSRKARSSPP